MLEPTHEEVTRAIEFVVAESGPDFIYRRKPDATGIGKCWYVHEGQPSCLVGQVLYRLGAGTEELGMIENTGIVAASRFLRGEGLVDLPSRSVEALKAAQLTQDAGHPWGEALSAFHGKKN